MLGHHRQQNNNIIDVQELRGSNAALLHPFQEQDGDYFANDITQAEHICSHIFKLIMLRAGLLPHGGDTQQPQCYVEENHGSLSIEVGELDVDGEALPGTVILHFDKADQGLVLQSLECSNQSLTQASLLQPIPEELRDVDLQECLEVTEHMDYLLNKHQKHDEEAIQRMHDVAADNIEHNNNLLAQAQSLVEKHAIEKNIKKAEEEIERAQQLQKFNEAYDQDSAGYKYNKSILEQIQYQDERMLIQRTQEVSEAEYQAAKDELLAEINKNPQSYSAQKALSVLVEIAIAVNNDVRITLLARYLDTFTFEFSDAEKESIIDTDFKDRFKQTREDPDGGGYQDEDLCAELSSRFQELRTLANQLNTAGCRDEKLEQILLGIDCQMAELKSGDLAVANLAADILPDEEKLDRCQNACKYLKHEWKTSGAEGKQDVIVENTRVLKATTRLLREPENPQHHERYHRLIERQKNREIKAKMKDFAVGTLVTVISVFGIVFSLGSLAIPGVVGLGLGLTLIGGSIIPGGTHAALSTNRLSFRMQKISKPENQFLTKFTSAMFHYYRPVVTDEPVSKITKSANISPKQE